MVLTESDLWIMPSELEEYLDVFDAVQRQAIQLSQISNRVWQVGKLLTDNPEQAFTEIPKDWPTGEQLTELLKEFISSKAKLKMFWERIPQRVRDSVSGKSPEMADRIAISVPR